MTTGPLVQPEPPAPLPRAARRLALPLAVWLGGAALLALYPPVQLAVRTTVIWEVEGEQPPTYVTTEEELVLDTWNTTAWLWADAQDTWALRRMSVANRVHRLRLLAQLALWTGVVWAGA